MTETFIEEKPEYRTEDLGDGLDSNCNNLNVFRNR